MPVSEFHLHMGSLLELTQTGTIAEYTAMFREHLHWVEDEIIKEATLVPKKLDDSCAHPVHGLTPTEILTDAFPDLTTLVECGADHNFTIINVSTLATPTPTTGSVKCPSGGATIDMYSKLATPVVRDEALNININGVAAPVPPPTLQMIWPKVATTTTPCTCPCPWSSGIHQWHVTAYFHSVGKIITQLNK